MMDAEKELASLLSEPRRAPWLREAVAALLELRAERIAA